MSTRRARLTGSARCRPLARRSARVSPRPRRTAPSRAGPSPRSRLRTSVEGRSASEEIARLRRAGGKGHAIREAATLQGRSGAVAKVYQRAASGDLRCLRQLVFYAIDVPGQAGSQHGAQLQGGGANAPMHNEPGVPQPFAVAAAAIASCTAAPTRSTNSRSVLMSASRSPAGVCTIRRCVTS